MYTIEWVMHLFLVVLMSDCNSSINFSGHFCVLVSGKILSCSLSLSKHIHFIFVFFFQAEDGIRDYKVTGVQTCALPIFIEPCGIKVVEPIRITDRTCRERVLREAHYNLFQVHAGDVTIDLLPDRGTAAMSAQQWSAMMSGDESYAGSRSFYRFEKVAKDLTGFRHIIPVHQGRAAEKILFGIVGGHGKIVPANSHFDTTRANVEYTGAQALDLLIPEGRDPQSEHPFKGNIDLVALENCLSTHGAARVPLVLLTVTNNAGGGQPVSLENIRKTRDITRRHGVPLFLDACRFAENAYFIKLREPGQAGRPVRDIAREMYSLA